jgi:hypothetical protein
MQCFFALPEAMMARTVEGCLVPRRATSPASAGCGSDHSQQEAQVDRTECPRYFLDMKQGLIAAFRRRGCCMGRCCVGEPLA